MLQYFSSTLMEYIGYYDVVIEAVSMQVLHLRAPLHIAAMYAIHERCVVLYLQRDVGV